MMALICAAGLWRPAIGRFKTRPYTAFIPNSTDKGAVCIEQKT